MNSIFQVLKRMIDDLKNSGSTALATDTHAKSSSCKGAQSSSSDINSRQYDYASNCYDMRIVTANGTLILTDDRTIGGLWSLLDFTPCSGTEGECLDEMSEFIASNFEDACESLVFEIRKRTYLLNLSDAINRHASSGFGRGYMMRLEQRIRVFYPIIRRFVEKYSEQNRLGFVYFLGEGTCVGLAALLALLKSDGYECYVEQADFSFLRNSDIPVGFRESLSDSNFESFDCRTYISDGASVGVFDTIIEKMIDRVIFRMNRTPKEKGDLDDNVQMDSSSMLISYGQVRTLADILVGLDQERHFTDSRSAIDAVQEYVMNQEQGHMNISSQAFSVMAHILDEPDSFVDGHLCCGAVKKFFEQKRFHALYEEAMFKYCYAKIWKLICYLNDFRRYSSAEEIMADLMKLHLHDYCSMFDCWANYPQFFFRRAINEAWPVFAPHGCIDQSLLNKYMFENHESSVRAIGLERTISRDFVMNACHADAFSPKLIGTAPVYVKRENANGRRFVKSCGEGIGPYHYSEAHEFKYAEKLLWNDSRYCVYGEYDCYWAFCPKYIVPVCDRTLPVYACLGECVGVCLGERIIFNTDDERDEFYKNALSGLCIAGKKEIDDFNRRNRC